MLALVPRGASTDGLLRHSNRSSRESSNSTVEHFFAMLKKRVYAAHVRVHSRDPKVERARLGDP